MRLPGELEVDKDGLVVGDICKAARVEVLVQAEPLGRPGVTHSLEHVDHPPDVALGQRQPLALVDVDKVDHPLNLGGVIKPTWGGGSVQGGIQTPVKKRMG